MNAHKMNSTLRCLVIKASAIFFIFLFSVLFADLSHKQKVYAFSSYVHFYQVFIHVFFSSILIFRFSLYTDNNSDVEMLEFLFIALCAQCEAAFFTIYTCAPRVQSLTI